MQQTSLDEEWQRYRKLVIPRDASPAQILFAYSAFMAGAFNTIQVLATAHLGDDGVAMVDTFINDVSKAVRDISTGLITAEKFSH